MTHVIDIFLEADRARSAGVAMTPRSKNDKEYFPQDWFTDRLNAVGLTHAANGRNSYPDFWVGDAAAAPPVEGFEIKSLSFATGRPARADFDSNSTVPSGRKDGHDVFVVFFLYTGAGANPRPVDSLVIAHTDLINADHDVAGAHFNAGIPGFGSYGDGHIRNRKMYRFPHPYTIEPSLIGRCSLVVPTAWSISDPRLVKVTTLQRTVHAHRVRSYTIDLQDQEHPTVNLEASPQAGHVIGFDVFEAR